MTGRDGEALVFGGLDLSNLDSTSVDEVEAFTTFYENRFGHQHAGLTYLLQNRPDALKRFRLYVRVGYSLPEAAELPFNLGFLAYYAFMGYTTGIRYLIRVYQQGGFSKEQCFDGIAMAALVGGPMALDAIATSLTEYNWQEPTRATPLPAEWDGGLDALHSGLDFSNHEMQEHERGLLRDWYMRWVGEVPPYVALLEEHHPDALKAYRNRFEHCLRVLPRQALPLTLLHFYVMCGSSGGIRENVRLARGFGATRDQIVRTIVAGMEYGGAANIDLVASVAKDALKA